MSLRLNQILGGADIRSPIFYDSNDTGYYLDPASTSRLNTINVGASGVIINNASTAAERNLKVKATGSGNGSGVGIALYDSSDTFRCQIYGEASNYGFLDSVWGGWDIKKTIGGSLFLNNNNTYYLNPASTTVLNALSVSVNNGLNPAVGTWHTSSEGKARFYFASNDTTYFRTGNNFVFRNNSDIGVVTIDSVGNLRTSTSGDNFASYSLHVGGTGFASADFRSPIFYDSNNTAYYVDPASTGYSAYFAGAIQATKIGIEDGGIDCYMEITDANPVIYGVTYGGEFIFYGDKSTPASFLYYGGATVTYTLQANSSLRAPIFYDSNNTAYYIDAASTSNLNNLTVAGTMTFGTLAYVTESRRSKNSSNVDIETVTGLVSPSGPTFLEIRGFCPPTMYRTTGDRPAPYGLGFGNGSESGGIMPIGAGDNLQEIMLYGANSGPTTFTFKRQIWEAATYDPSYSNYYGSAVFSINTGTGAVTASTDIRSPIYYDQNDTTYYIDPASTSRLVALWVRGSSETVGNIYVGGTAAGDRLNINYDQIWTPNGNLHLQYSGGGNIDMNYGGGFTFSRTSLRAPIFYDYNDTSYYVDPSSTSIMLYVRAANFHDSTGSYNVNLGSGNSEGRGLVAGYSGGSYGGIGYNVRHTTTGGSWIAPSTDTSTYLLFSNGIYFYYAAGGAAGRTLSYSTIGSLTSAGIFTVSGDVRAPVFYDSNDTSYYVDPASTSRVNTLYVANSITDSSTVNGRILLYGNLHIDAYNGYDIYCNYYSGRRFRTFKGLGTGAEIFRTDTDGIVYAYEQLRTPVLYDYNDTTYYIDPASTSNIVELKTNKNWYDSSGSVWGGGINMGGNNPTIGFQSTASTWWFMFHHSSSAINFYRRSTSGGWNQDGIWDSSSNFIWQGSSVRAPIFYDQNNTAYYTDPASTSVLYSIAAGVAGNSSANIPALKVTSSGTATTQAAIAIQQQASEGDTIIFCDFDQYVEWNLVHENVNNQLIIHGGTSTSNLGSNTFYSPNGTAKTGYIKHVFDMTDGNAYIGGSVGIGTNGPGQKLDVRGTIISNSDVRAPIFYDSDNTGYYLNPAGSSQLSAVYANDWFRAQGNTGLYFQDKGYGITSAGAASNSYGNASTYGSGLNGWQGWGIGSRHCMMSTGGDNFGIHDNTRSWLYYWDGTYHRFQYGYLQSANSVRGPLFYDSDDTGYYLDPASTSNLATVYAIESYARNWFRNVDSGEGLYNESTGQHFYSDDNLYWNVASSGTAQGIRLRTGGYNGTVRGYFYANNSNDVGFLNSGGNWRARIVGGDYALFDGSSIRGQIFYDSNDTNYYCDPNGSSVLASVSARGYYPVAGVTESDIYAQSLAICAYHHGDSLTYDTFQFNAASTYETRATVGSSFVSASVETGIFKGDRFGGMTIANNVYQVRWTWSNTIGYKFFKSLYIANSTNGNSFTVTIEASGNGTTWTTIATSTAMSNWPGHSWYNYAWNNNAYQGYIRITVTPTWVNANSIGIYNMRYFCSYNLDAGARLYDWDYNRNVTFAAIVDATQFRDSSNTAYYLDPASTSNLVGLTVANTITGSISGTAGSETLGTISGRGNNTSTQLIVSTAAGQAMYVGRQIGGSYSYGSGGIFTALSDNTNGTLNAFFQGYVGSSSNTPGGTLTYSVRADGQIYTTMNTATGIANNSFNVAKTILGSIHIANGSGTSGNNNQAAITFQGSSSNEAQAGIYVSNNSSSGTAMAFATTDSYGTGPQIFMSANNVGVVNFSRARPTYAGNTILDTANYSSYAIARGGDTVDGVIYFRSNKGATSTVGANNSYALEAFSSDAGAAGMSFHRGGYYAINMGLDYDNVFRIGGWSASANRLQLDMSGNLTLAGVVDATQFRDSGNTAYYIDPASTSNIIGLTVANTITGNISGNAGTVTNGVYLSGAQTIGGVKTFSDPPVALNIAKAWVHFNGTSSVGVNCTVNASYNISSVAHNATGDYTVNFTNSFTDTNYVVAGTITYDYTLASSLYNGVLSVPRQSGAQSTGSCRIAAEYLHGANLYDAVAVRAVFFR